eukprot:4727910-Amphidinium_carterae.2
MWRNVSCSQRADKVVEVNSAVGHPAQTEKHPDPANPKPAKVGCNGLKILQQAGWIHCQVARVVHLGVCINCD